MRAAPLLLSWGLAWGLGGCLLALPPPPSLTCEPKECPHGYACDTQREECFTDCSASEHCRDGFICYLGECERACEEDNCPGGFACEPLLNECREECIDNSDCRGDFRCCTSTRFESGLCNDRRSCFQ